MINSDGVRITTTIKTYIIHSLTYSLVIGTEAT